MNKLLNFGLGMIAGAALWSAGAPARAQESPAHQTRVWQVAAVKNPADWWATDVYAVDTEGVCLYVARTQSATGQPVLAAVPKTQLPQGVGCQ
jgi:hypothetical protein